MRRPRDWLVLAPRAGAPGGAAPVAVPRMPQEAARAELDDVLAVIGEVQARCAQICATARAGAFERRAAAAREARTIVDRAHDRAAEERRAACATALAAGKDEITALASAATTAAATAHDAAARVEQEVVANVVALLHAHLAELTGTDLARPAVHVCDVAS